jgi:FKBP-type peptidyl-prolyl cis-trans isomerase
MKRLLLLIGCLSLAACNLDTTGSNVTNTPSDPTTEPFAAGLGVNISQMTKVAVGPDFIYIKDLKAGTGAQVTAPSATVQVSYQGFLSNGFRFGNGTSQTFGLAGTVLGFQNGIVGMKVGGERLIVIPSNLGYGPVINGPIPANSTLVFDVSLENIF